MRRRAPAPRRPLRAALTTAAFALLLGLPGVLPAEDARQAERRSDALLKLWQEGRRDAMTEALPAVRAATARREVQELRRLRILALLPLGETLTRTGRGDLRALEAEVGDRIQA